MAAGGEPQDGIFGEQPLGRREAAEPQSLVGVIERQLELTPSARVHPLHRFRWKPQPYLPDQLAPGEPEAVASPHPHEMLDRGALELGCRAAPCLNSSQNPAISSRLRRRLMARRNASAWPAVNPESAWHTCSTWS